MEPFIDMVENGSCLARQRRRQRRHGARAARNRQARQKQTDWIQYISVQERVCAAEYGCSPVMNNVRSSRILVIACEETTERLGKRTMTGEGRFECAWPDKYREYPSTIGYVL